MLTSLNRLFRRSPAARKTGNDTADSAAYEEEIPRYPPFAKGLPVAPIDRVIDSQKELIGRIRASLGLNKEQYNTLILPVIARYAAFVHLLPASESHHHRGAGGLFRHGLEVAFWAAQASEAIIFSMEGSPLERRNNEPRWRIASCFAGLLHDVGKPLSDVSVTDKDGKLTWNPYANSLHAWAEKNNIDRYFLRWRDNRHKRHEQFSLLTIERILPPEVLQYLSEPGPEILESMLEAIAGTSSNQPVTKLMLRADQESVARDLKQSRLDVDEFSYGVPVERYVFDAIRRLIKTGKWKTNEPGARVWHLHQGAFITWRQLGDLYTLIEKDQVPGIPRDPDTLADILIERGFAIPFQPIDENGEMSRYRYWEVCPDMLQPEGAPLSVKLLVLRLESHELIYTTEPPSPVSATLIGEREEPKITFKDLDADNATEASVDMDLVPHIVSPNPTNAEPVAFTKSGIPSVPAKPEKPETDVVPINSSQKAPPKALDQMIDADADLDFMFAASEPAQTPAIPQPTPTPTDNSEPHVEANGASAGCVSDDSLQDDSDAQSSLQPQSPALAQPELKLKTNAKSVNTPGNQKDEASTDVVDLGGLFLTKAEKEAEKEQDLAIHNQATVTPKRKARSKTKVNAKVAHKPSPVLPSLEKSASATSGKTSPNARNVLNKHLEIMPKAARTIISDIVSPVLNGQTMLGEALIIIKGQPVLIYPDGAKQFGEPQEILSTLMAAGLIVPDPVTPGRKVHAFEDFNGLLFEPKLAKQIIEAFAEAEQTLDAQLDASFPSHTTAPLVASNVERPSEPITLSSNKVEPVDTPTSLTTAKPSVPTASKIKHKLFQKKSKTLDVQDDQPRQNSTTARPFIKPIADAPATTQAIAKLNKIPLVDFDVPVVESHQINQRGIGELTADFNDISPKELTAKDVIEELKTMMINRRGRWLVSSVKEENGYLVTSYKAFFEIAKEHKELSSSRLRGYIGRSQPSPELKIRNGQLKLKLINGSTQK
jgi:conjugal transfer pilus assembly protein TraI